MTDDDLEKRIKNKGKIDLSVVPIILLCGAGLFSFYFKMYVEGSIYFSAMCIIYALERGFNAIIERMNEIGSV